MVLEVAVLYIGTGDAGAWYHLYGHHQPCVRAQAGRNGHRNDLRHDTGGKSHRAVQSKKYIRMEMLDEYT